MFELPDYDADDESTPKKEPDLHISVPCGEGDIGIKKESSKTFIKSEKVAGESSGILSKSPVLIDFLAGKQSAVFGGTEFASLINGEHGKDEKTPSNDTVSDDLSAELDILLSSPEKETQVLRCCPTLLMHLPNMEKPIHKNHVVTSKGKRNLNPQFEEAAADADGRGFKIAKVVLMLVILTMNVQSVGRVSSYQNVLKETLQLIVLDSVNDGSGPPQFIITGQNYHRIGSLLPDPGLYLSLHSYIVFYSRYNVQTSEIDKELIIELLQMIDTHNVIAQLFRRVREFYQCHPSEIFSLKLYSHRKVDRRTYNTSSCDEVAALIVGDFDSLDHGHDIIVRSTTGQLQRIYKTHALYWPLQYPLLFPYGEDGYQLNIPYRGQQEGYVPGRRTRVSLREFICFRLQIREQEDGIIHKCRRLFQQFVVDCFTMIESQRLYEIRMKQSAIRGEVLQGIEEAMRRGDDEASSIGTRVGVFADVMEICKHFGYPDLFLTITCNPNWPEFQRFTERERIPIADRPDISCRVFHAKLKCLLSDLKEGMYTIEFQKRGLPHAHMLLWLNGESNLQSFEIVDEFICAELPNPLKFPALYNVVTKYMIYGPCGRLRPSSPCMKDGKCSKFYPKRFVDQMRFDEDGYPIYRCRNMGVTVKINDVDIDNKFVVPYNPLLLMKYQAHINLEFCNKSNVIKYLFKYINKDPDRVTATVGETYHVSESSQVVDEIKQYYDCRYLSPSESMWRIFAYDIHHRWPSVQRLTFHLPNQQHVVFDDADITTHVYLRNKDLLTMFTGWMMANRRFPDGRSLTYVEYPGKFVYCSNSREWKPKQRGFSIGRLSFAHPSSGELFYMRMLLNEACSAMGFLIDDKEYVSAIKEVAEVASAVQLRRLFVILLLSGSMGRPLSVWEQTWTYLFDDILYRRRHELQYPDLTMSQDELQTFCLLEIEKLLQIEGVKFVCENTLDIVIPLTLSFEELKCISFIELYIEFEQSEADQNIELEDYNNDREEEFERNYEIVDLGGDEDQDDGTIEAEVAEVTNALINQHTFVEPNFMRSLNLETMHALEFPQHINAGSMTRICDL
ncbi:uncharacterized protein LOC107621388 [Arachis ipaensis]|uniref:uncharacterized protein LOC107621388 n=1 Tax=Arachis ipaensis TaxID=130454 RepID=UPI000A2B4A15|nr:uncharacterized protein LOC107621388 [Arachis ipaensis]